MKKLMIGIAIVALLLSANFALAAGKSGQPFQALWDAVASLQQQIEDIESVPGETGPQGPQGPKGESGDLPAGMLPSPAYDSGWVNLPARTAVIDLTHNLGGDIDDYFIYATYQRPNGSMKSHQTAANVIWWEDITNTGIQIATNGDVTNNFVAARIRIWLINDSE